MPSPLADPVKLPCGLVLSNRLAKVGIFRTTDHNRPQLIDTSQAAMAELLAGWDNKPTPTLLESYNQWSQGGWGAILTG